MDVRVALGLLRSACLSTQNFGPPSQVAQSGRSGIFNGEPKPTEGHRRRSHSGKNASAACGCVSVLTVTPFVSGGLCAGPWMAQQPQLARPAEAPQRFVVSLQISTVTAPAL